MFLQTLKENGRLVSIVAATVISLACGTNYAYSSWAPQFAQQMKLSSTQSNLIGAFGNVGMYASGLPSGVLVDAKGPRWGVALGVLLFAAGYYPIRQAYVGGPGTFGVPMLCVFYFFTGAGSAAAFTAALKTAALNYPLSRGTATAFPLAAFGLSAFLFSAISAFALRDDTSELLLLLAIGTVLLPVVSFPFVRIYHSPHYDRLLPRQARHDSDCQVLLRTKSTEFCQRVVPQSTSPQGDTQLSHEDQKAQTAERRADHAPQADNDEASSLLSNSSDPNSVECSCQKVVDAIHDAHDVRNTDVRGFALLPLLEFWQLFLMLGLLTGIGLMTINNIGNDAQALWRYYDPSMPDLYIQRRQGIHVCIISFGSFCGRLLSGIGSDFLVQKLNRSRFWCLFASALVFSVAQLCATVISNPYFLVVVSGLTGLAYGLLFGVYPSLVANTFGVHGMSQNWGTMTLAPVITGNFFNILYGRIYDSHSIVNDEGDMECLKGLKCYGAAYWFTFFSGICGAIVCLWSVWHENEVHRREEKSGRRTDHDREA